MPNSPDPDKSTLYSDQISQLYRHASVGIIATLVNSIIIVLILPKQVAHTRLIVWVTLIVLASVINAIVLYGYKHSEVTPDRVQRWSRSFIAGMALSGVVWGAYGILLFPSESPAHQAFLVFVLGGMVAGAAGAFSAILAAFFAYSIPALAPVTIKLFMIGDEVHVAMGFMTILFGCLMSVTARLINRATLNSLKAGHENRELITYLTAQKSHVEGLNGELAQEITNRRETERLLQEARGKLEQRVNERTSELMAANRHLRLEIEGRRHAEKELEISKREWETTFNAMQDWVCLIDLNKRILRTNNAGESFVGLPAAEIVGKSSCCLVHGTDKPEDACPVEQMMKTRHRESAELERHDLDACWTVSADPVLDDRGELRGAVHIIRDVTEQKKLQRHLYRAQRMESLAVLAGGIAHQFNNALTPITLGLGLVEGNLSMKESYRALVQQMIASCRRMHVLTNQLLAYARGGRYNAKRLFLTDVIHTTLPMLAHIVDSSIRIETHFPEEVWAVEADEMQLQMLLSAVLNNASEAIEKTGVIQIRVENEDIDQGRSKEFTGLRPGRYVCMTIKDDGKGMNEETKRRVFEPFFTTKFPGRGLGLASAYGIVKNHGGWIYISSKIGRGTTVRIFLPALEPNLERSKAKRPSDVSRDTGTIPTTMGPPNSARAHPGLLTATAGPWIDSLTA